MLARDHATQGAREPHDARDRGIGLAQHVVVVGIDGKVGVHVAVAGMHVQRDEHAAAQHACVRFGDARHDRREGKARKDLLQWRLELAFPGNDQRVFLQRRERRVDAVEQILPAFARGRDQLARLLQLGGDDLRRRPHVASGRPSMVEQRTRQPCREFVAQLHLVPYRQLDVDPFDAVGVVTQAVQRDDHILVNLERIGVPGDGGRARAVQPEFLARLRRHGHEAFGPARVGDAHDLGRGPRHRVVVVADDVAQQHHLRPSVPLGLRGVADGLHIALVEMLEAGQHDARVAFLRQGIDAVLDLDNGRRRIAHLSEEFEADGADGRRHCVQDEARACNEPVAAFFLDAR